MRDFIRMWGTWRQSPPRAASVVVPGRTGTARVRGPYEPLYGYLEHRHSATVVLSFLDIEALLGFPLPAMARSDRGWWDGNVMSGDRHADAWATADRRATANIAARTVAFERVT